MHSLEIHDTPEVIFDQNLPCFFGGRHVSNDDRRADWLTGMSWRFVQAGLYMSFSDITGLCISA